MCGFVIEPDDGDWLYSINDLRDAGWHIPDDTIERLRDLYPDDHPLSNHPYTDDQILAFCFCGSGEALPWILEANGCEHHDDGLGITVVTKRATR